MIARVHVCPHFAYMTGTLIHLTLTISTPLNVPLLSGPKWSICPVLIFPLITVPARIILSSIRNLSLIKNYVFISVLFLMSLTAGRRFRNEVKISRFYPVTLETGMIGVTASVATIL